VTSQSRIPNPESRILGDSRLSVSAAVLRDSEGRVLLAQRPVGKAHAGLWEYPGGKLEDGESPAQALARELREELGIDLDPADCVELIRLPWSGSGIDLWLHVLQVRRWRGEPVAHEAQALRWVVMEDLGAFDMPPADRPVAAVLQQPALYAITPEPGVDEFEFLRHFEALLQRGLRRIQLRARSCEAGRLKALARACAERARAAGAELMLNGEIDLARELGLGLHLRASQLGELDARPLPEGQALAASCHDAQELALAEALGVDFAVLGPVRPTASHPGAPALGWEGFVAARCRSPLPVYALGGLQAADFPEARRHGAQGIAGISGFWVEQSN